MGGCGSPIMKLVCKISAFVAALGSIHLGLMALGYDAMTVLKLQDFEKPMGYVFGVAGVISLVMLCMWCMKHHSCNCATGSCTCK